MLHRLANGRAATIKPIIGAAVAPGALVHTDASAIYTHLPSWGYGQNTLCHGRGEYARDEDGGGFYDVHVNTMEGFWSLLQGNRVKDFQPTLAWRHGSGSPYCLGLSR